MTEEPLYNIGVVTRVTGVPIPTLHAWERRYGFPQAGRTAGGHRLYSEKDITRLRWVKAQVDSGMAVSRAVIAARSLEAEGRLFLPSLPESRPGVAQSISAESMKENLATLLVRHDLDGADRLLGELLAFRSPEELALEVIAPALAELGDAWERGEITIPTEHLASNYLRHRLLMWMVTGPATRPVNPVALACAPGDWHEGSLLMLGVLLRRRGWPVAYLGQNVPLEGLAEFSREIQPSALVFVAMRQETARALIDWPARIPQMGGKPFVAFGGRAFIKHPELVDLVPGYYLGDTLQGGVTKIETLLS